MQPLRVVVRRLRQERQFSLGVIVVLALAIGGTGALLTLFHAVILRPLAVPEPERLVAVYPGLGDALLGVPIRTLLALRDGQDVVEDLCGYSRGALEIDGAGARLTNEGLTGGCYRMLGVQPFMGRLIAERDAPDAGESAPVTVISHRFWTRAFGADPAAIGRTLRANGVLLTIIGVTPPGFDGIDVERAPDLTVPLGTMARLAGGAPESTFALLTIGRLREDVSIAQARAQLRAMWPGVYANTNPVPPGRPASPAAAAESLRVESMARGLSEQRVLYGSALSMLTALSGLLLLLASLNAGGLFLARTMGRARELRIRTMLGAAPRHLGVLLCLESVLLAAGAALAAVPIAWWASRTLAATMWIRTMPTTMDVAPGASVLAAIAAAGVVLGLLVSLPSLGVVLLHSRRAADAQTVAATTSWRRTLIVAQVAVSVVLVFGAGLFMRNLSMIRSIDPGYAADAVRWTRLEVAFGQPRSIDHAAYFRPVLEQIRALPAVTEVALSLSFPTTELRHVTALTPLARAGTAPGEQGVSGRVEYASPDFFATLDVPFIEGRDFTWADVEGQPGVAIVNQTLATRLFPAGDALGATLELPAAAGIAAFTIVGVTGSPSPGDVRIGELPIVYLALLQNTRFMAAPILVLRTAGDAGLAPGVRSAIEPLGRHRVDGLQTIGDQAARFHMRERVMAGLAAAAAGLSLLIGSLGLYALLTHTVIGRTRELGLRMALGAARARVLAMVVRDGMVLVALGVAFGVPVALASGRAARTLLFAPSPYDARALAAACLILMGVGLLACGWPAVRAIRIAPAEALKHE